MVNLRDYQVDILKQIAGAFSSGYTRPLVVAPCGSGKSYVFAALAEQTPGNVLILTHRRELLKQHNQLLDRLGVSGRVSMVLTESKHLKQPSDVDLIILDEAHLSRSRSWETVINHYNAPCVGFTATPIRLDGRPLGDVYDTLIQSVDVTWLIDHNRLAPYDYYAPITVDTDNVRISRGDFHVGDLARIMSDNAIYSNAVSAWEQYAKRGKTIAYCINIQHANDVAKKFRSQGIRAESISSHTKREERDKIMDRFRRGDIDVLCNVGILAEGISIDDITCCLLLRPTQSHALYWQQAMRCMRYIPGKRAVIIDCAGNFARNPMPTDDVEWSLTKRAKASERINPDGNFYIRTCPVCFRVFKTADRCPYCGSEYPLHPREIKAHEQIELAKIDEQKQAEIAAEKRRLRQEVGMARTYGELVAIARKRGYNMGWVHVQMRLRSGRR